MVQIGHMEKKINNETPAAIRLNWEGNFFPLVFLPGLYSFIKLIQLHYSQITLTDDVRVNAGQY